MAEWRQAFWIVVAMLLVTNTIYVLLASADVQPWDRSMDENPSPLAGRLSEQPPRPMAVRR